MITLLVSVLIFTPVWGIYEDQIGKFDWRQQYVGVPESVWFERSQHGDRLLVATRENAIAALSVNTGKLLWRRLQETRPDAAPIGAGISEKLVFSVTDGGRILRAWHKRNGAIAWERSFADEISTGAPQVLVSGKNVYVLTSSAAAAFNINGDELWKQTLPKNSWSKAVLSGDSVKVVLYSADAGFTVQSLPQRSLTTISLPNANTQKCSVSGSSLLCAHSTTLTLVDLTSDTNSLSSVDAAVSIREIVSLEGDLVAAKGSDVTVVYKVNSERLDEILRIKEAVRAITTASPTTIIAESNAHLLVFDVASGNELVKLPRAKEVAPAAAIFAARVKDQVDVVTVRLDARVDLHIVDLAKKTEELEWHREESMARIASVEMVDLPLSEMQQLIEDEFEGNGGPIAPFVRRLIAQVGQLQKWIVRTLNEIFMMPSLLKTKGSFSDLMTSLRMSSKQTHQKGDALERDFFNLRKMLVVVTLDGTVFGLDSVDGSVLWRLWMGEHFAPLTSSRQVKSVPLFVQRSTAHYQLCGRAAVVFRDMVTKFGNVHFFDPITGKTLETRAFRQPIERVELLPWTSDEHVHSLLVIEKGGKVNCLPPLSDAQTQSATLHLLNEDGSKLWGSRLTLSDNEMKTVWTLDLGLSANEKIIAVKGKPRNQKVHSQGRVLIDRNVQYKYVNPNLVAVATLDSVNQDLGLYMVDSVTGQIVYSSKLPKTTGPIHLIHCEHWLAYAYWSEKGRRTELGVMEMYEGGEEQSQKDAFDSLVPTRRPLEVLSQSYIYAHGINAMAVTDTEQGLTTRALLLALPTGSIQEVSKRLLDATRPLEITQEMREEGMIGYVPEIGIPPEDFINYNQTVHNIRGMKTAPSGLESTSLLLAYGIDVFFTRLHPSGTFDILKDDFDHLLISLVLFGLIAGSIIAKRLARLNSVKAAWA